MRVVIETVTDACKATWKYTQYWQFLDQDLDEDGELDSMVLMSPFQLEIVYDSMI